MNNKRVRTICFAGLVAAVYAAVTLALAPIAFGNIQCRIAEALTLLAILCPQAVGAVTLGCFISNLIGVFMGVNILGVVDVFAGTLATLMAGIISYRARKIRVGNIPWLSVLAPIVMNGLVIGAELAYVLAPEGAYWTFFAINTLEVAAGEAIACIVLGLPLVLRLEKLNVIEKLGL